MALSLLACGKKPSPPDAQVSNFTLNELNPPAGGPQWDEVKVIMDRKSPDPATLPKTFPRSSFKSGKFEDTVFKVEYGTYQIDLQYSDKSKKLVYQACENERAKQHEIRQPTFQVAIEICQVTASGDEKPTGIDVTIKPSADVTITPNLVGSGDQGGTSGTGAVISGNPFVGVKTYVNPEYSKQVDSSIARSPDLASKMQKLKNIGTAIWIDRIAKIPSVEKALGDARALQKSSGQKILVNLVVYNLPERDCAAYASAGELSVADDGMRKYKTQYIDPIAKLFKEYSDLRIAAIIEPDSLPNLATNMNVAKCQVAAPLYKEGVAYAVEKLSLPNTSLYLDSAHGGWLGWPENRRKMAAIFADVLETAGGSEKIRGFATNVSNYSATQIQGQDNNGDAFYESNPARDEMTFVRLFAEDLAQAGVKNRFFVIDTSRNGQIETRKVRGSWCNVSKAGIGRRPEVNPSAGVDAFIWVKPPGESDGTSDRSAKRYDTMCGNQDAMQDAPEAGQWFHSNFQMLVKNAVPAL